MKLRNIVLENISSFRDKIEVEFNDDLNIFVGPNGGGKSNLFDAIVINLRRHLLAHCRVIEERGKSSIQVLGDYPHWLKWSSSPSGPMATELKMLVTETDIHNLRAYINNKDDAGRELNRRFQGGGLAYNPPPNQLDKLHIGQEVSYKITNENIIGTQSEPELIIRGYANWLEYMMFLCPEVYPVFAYVSAHRASVNSDDLRVVLSSKAHLQFTTEYFNANPRQASSSLLSLGAHYFVLKYRRYLEFGNRKGFTDDKQTKIVTQYLKQLGYSWDVH